MSCAVCAAVTWSMCRRIRRHSRAWLTATSAAQMTETMTPGTT